MRLTGLALLALLTAPLAGQGGRVQDSLRANMQRWVAESRAVGLVVGRDDRDGQSVVVAGLRRAGGTEPLALNALFEIGSITKAFTGMLLAEMVLRGEVSLDDPVARHLPADWTVPGGTREITLLDLATHTSGLPRMPAGFSPANSEDPYADADDASLRNAVATSTLATPPGATYAYSNLGAALLGRALAHRAGMPYERLLRERIIAPLGMTDVHFTYGPNELARAAFGHTATLQPTPAWNFTAYAPAGGLRTSGASLVHVAHVLMDTAKSPLRAAFALASRGHRATSPAGDSIGLGWHINRFSGLRVVWHNGGTGGFRTFIGMVPDSNRAVVVLNNASLGWTDRIAIALLAHGVPADPPVVVVPREIHLPAAELQKFVGAYPLNPEFVLDITQSGDTLFVQATGQQKLPLAASGPTTFFLRVVEAELRFEVDAAGAVVAVVLHQGGAQQRALRR